MSVKVKTVVNLMEKLCPSTLAFEWDNVGLLIGDLEHDVDKILIALDATDNVVEEAIEYNCKLIITHHPVIFKPVKKVSASNPVTKKIMNIIKHDISVFSAHTNLDIAKGGTNDVLADLLSLSNTNILKPLLDEKLNKVVTYVPIDHAENVRAAMCNAGAGNIGNYSDCCFYTSGKGTFLPLDNTTPFIGQQGILETVDEIRIETVVPQSKTSHVVQMLKNVHPYEEVAFDVYELKNDNAVKYGIGRIGHLDIAVPLEQFANLIKINLGLSFVNVVGNKDTLVKKVAIVTGSGAEFIELAAKSGADVLVTGDIKFHEAQRAQEFKLCLIDATHYASENIIVPIIAKYLSSLNNNNKVVDILESTCNEQPFTLL